MALVRLSHPTSDFAGSSDSSNASYWKQPLPAFQRDRNFTYDFCDCFGDCGACLSASFALPCLVSSNSARLDNNENEGGCCYPASGAKNRRQAKAQFGIKDDCGTDTMACFFPCLSEVQVKREIDLHYGGVMSPKQQRMA
jgi:hypothetical protein